MSSPNIDLELYDDAAAGTIMNDVGSQNHNYTSPAPKGKSEVTLKYHLIGSEASLFEHLLRCQGFERTFRNDWNLLWIAPGTTLDKLPSTKPLQKCNRFPMLEKVVQPHKVSSMIDFSAA